MAMLGIIGGTGLYKLGGAHLEARDVDTPFGPPSGPLQIGELDGAPVAFLARHGANHSISPSNLPFRANIHALKSVGVTHVLSVSATGSLREEIRPGDLVIPDQIIDRTRARASTFFDRDLVAHVGVADPFCGSLRNALLAAAGERSAGATPLHDGGTYVCIEGPRFSTRAESRLYRSWGASVIGMTAMPEAALAREAELCYGMLALATDYDVWHETEADVTVELVMQTLQTATASAVEIIKRLIANGLPACEHGCPTALSGALTDAPDTISPIERERLGVILARYLGTAALDA